MFFGLGKKKNIFIHIPKTGGSTFIGGLKNSLKCSTSEMIKPTHLTEKVGNVEVLHVDFKDRHRRFKGGRLISDKKLSSRVNYFMLVRNPMNRLLSEFNFQYHILGGKNGNPSAVLFNKLKNKPKNFTEYIECTEVHNYQIKFLLGRELASSQIINSEDYQKVINSIEKGPINCGVTSQMDSFCKMFEEISDNKLLQEFTIRKRTPNNFRIKINQKLEDRIIELNKFDYQLYEYVLKNLERNNSVQSFNFNEKKEFIV